MTNENVSNITLDEKWLEWFYVRVTDQFTLSRQSLHNTHQWAISLTLGLMTAVLTFGGDKNPYPNEYGLIVILVSLPLLFRFFVRSCLESSIQYKWLEIRDSLDEYFYCSSENAPLRLEMINYLKESIELYYFKWRSPRSLWKISWENLRLAYLWPFLLWIMMVVWGAISLCMSSLIAIVVVVVAVFMIYEIVTFVAYRGFRYEKPKMPKPDIFDLAKLTYQNNSNLAPTSTDSGSTTGENAPG